MDSVQSFGTTLSCFLRYFTIMIRYRHRRKFSYLSNYLHKTSKQTIPTAVGIVKNVQHWWKHEICSCLRTYVCFGNEGVVGRPTPTLPTQRRSRRQGRLAWRQAGGRQPVDGIPLSHYPTPYYTFIIFPAHKQNTTLDSKRKEDNLFMF